MNPILIGQAEEIDLVQQQVRDMLAAPGFYIGGDTQNPQMNVPLVSMDGRVFSMEVDNELDPERFLETLTLKGPFRVDVETFDALALMDGWQKSAGAHLEMHVAHRVGMEIVIAREVVA